MTVTFTVRFLSALLTPFCAFMKKLQSWGVTSVGVCYMLVGLQICREVIFQVIKGDFKTAIIGLSSDHTSFVYNYICVIDQA